MVSFDEDRVERQALLRSVAVRLDGRLERRAEVRGGPAEANDLAAERPTVSCTYCREPIHAETFTFWSAIRKLVSADCPHCGWRVTLTTSSWHRCSGLPTSLLSEDHVFPWASVKQAI
jgi:DNA-directed RNA polymerase subunit RPC12/RpoP